MRKYFLFLLTAILLASCGTDPDINPDWCFTYDFTASDYDFYIADGSWVDGVGLQTDEGLLSFTYDYGSFVTPSIVYVNAQRVSAVVDAVLTTSGSVYGVASAFSVGIPSDNTDILTAQFRPAVTGDSGTTIDVSLEMTGYLTEELNLLSIEVQGMGASPFPDNPCDRVTPSPTATASATIASTVTPFPTGLPTFTATASATPTLTLTPPPTSTPPPAWDWEYIRDFSLAEGASDGIDGYDTFTNGSDCSAFANASYWDGDKWRIRGYMGMYFDDTQLYSIDLTFNVEASGSLTSLWRVVDGASALSLTGASTVYNRTNFGTGSRVESVNFGTPTDANMIFFYRCSTSGWTLLYDVNIKGYGVCPFNDGCVAEPTPTPTLTRTPSIPSPTPAGATRTPIGYTSPTPLNTSEPGTPSNTITPQSTLTYVPTGIPYGTAVVGEGTATPDDYTRENEAEYQILEELQRAREQQENMNGELVSGINGAFGWFFDFFQNLWDMIAGFFNAILQLIISAFAILLEILGIIMLLIQLLLGLMGLLLAYISQAISRLTALIGAFFTAPATPINGLPMCVTAPLSHDICAIYYIADWTLFAPGTAGAYIIPLLVAMINVILLFRFVNFVMDLVQEATNETS